MVVRKTERTPVPVSALPEFTPVPRQYNRHDGWTPDRTIPVQQAPGHVVYLWRVPPR